MANVAPFPQFRFQGVPREVGRQHGEALRDKIQQHLDLIYTRGAANSNLTRSACLELAGGFGPYVQQYTPDLYDEITGLAEGANIPLLEAMLLQVRQEAIHVARFHQVDLECTTFAVTAPFTKDGRTYAGQNIDMAGRVEEFAAVVTFAVPGKPEVHMVVPAGQLSHSGMNSEGMSANGNFLNSVGWRRGYPRYLLTRLALEQRDIKTALAKVLEPRRASSRNLLLADRHGAMVDIENTVDDHQLVWGEGYLYHANHYMYPEMEKHEVSHEYELTNSQRRASRMQELILAGRGVIDAAYLQQAFRDHKLDPDSICVHRRPPKDSHTFASLITHLNDLKMDVAKGPPCQNEYATYTF